MGKNLGSTLKELRKSKGLSAKEAADKLRELGFSVSNKTISGYESGIRMPNADIFMALCQVYDCKNVLEKFSFVTAEYSVPTDDEWSLIEKYRSLDQTGQETVKNTLNHEIKRVQVIRNLEDQLKAVELKANTKQDVDTHRYPYLRKIACAGTGFLFDDIPIDTIDVPYMYGADCIIGVNGDSMEPTYHDGDLLYVRKTNELQYGDIGIFVYAGECFIKEYGRRGLISHNPDYPNITGNEDIRIVGEVIGKVPEEYS